MDTLMLCRRAMMGGMRSGGGGNGTTVQETSIVADHDGTSSNKITVQMDAVAENSYLVEVWADELPEVHESYYGFVHWFKLWAYSPIRQQTVSSEAASGVLRPNGTYGTDAGMVGFTKATGVLTLGGSYGRFYEGATYHIKIISWNN